MKQKGFSLIFILLLISFIAFVIVIINQQNFLYDIKNKLIEMGSPIVTPTENVSPTSRSSDNSIELPISPTESPIMPTSTPSTPITPDPTNTPTKTQIESEELDRGKKVPFIGG